VRHEDVSEHLLRNYEPLPRVAGHLILRRRGLSGPPSVEPSRAYLDLYPCDWGFVPHFDEAPAGNTRELASLSLRASDSKTRIELEYAGQGGMSRGSYLELSFEDLRADRFVLHDGAQPADATPIAFRSRTEGRRTYSLHVGACPQWYGFTGNRLILQSSRDHGLREVRLVERL
jgi:hypothetical protein